MKIKICGLRTEDTVKGACAAGAAYIGFVFFEKSPRYVTAEQAKTLAWAATPGVVKTGLFVNPSDTYLDEILDVVPLDMVQLHGGESPERVTEIRQKYGLPVMKAIGLRDAADLETIRAYEPVADQILVDTKPPKTADLPGGNGLSFDWSILQGYAWKTPWMLAGGLTAENVRRAINLTGAQQLDLSSAVETAPGVKDIGLIQAFIAAAGGQNPTALSAR